MKNKIGFIKAVIASPSVDLKDAISPLLDTMLKAVPRRLDASQAVEAVRSMAEVAREMSSREMGDPHSLKDNEVWKSIKNLNPPHINIISW